MRKNLLVTIFVLILLWVITFFTFFMQYKIGLFPNQFPVWIWLIISLSLITFGVYLKERGIIFKDKK